MAGELAFAPADGVLVLRGTVAEDGRFAARLNTQPLGRPPYILSASGTLADDTATLTYVTPRCTATTTLARVHPGLF